MATKKRDPIVDNIISRAEKWRDELSALREIALQNDLDEEVKWGQPCYTHEGHNIAILGAFKDYCAMNFFKGALLNDPNGMLIQQTANVQAGRQLRYTSVGQIAEQSCVIGGFIAQAVEIERAGLDIEYKKPAEFPVPDELRAKMESDSDFKAAFEALTPGRQRAYLLHFAQPKQAKTREARIEKCAPQIMRGEGLNEYKG